LELPDTFFEVSKSHRISSPNTIQRSNRYKIITDIKSERKIREMIWLAIASLIVSYWIRQSLCLAFDTLATNYSSWVVAQKRFRANINSNEWIFTPEKVTGRDLTTISTIEPNLNILENEYRISNPRTRTHKVTVRHTLNCKELRHEH